MQRKLHLQFIFSYLYKPNRRKKHLSKVIFTNFLFHLFFTTSSYYFGCRDIVIITLLIKQTSFSPPVFQSTTVQNQLLRYLFKCPRSTAAWFLLWSDPWPSCTFLELSGAHPSGCKACEKQAMRLEAGPSSLQKTRAFTRG